MQLITRTEFDNLRLNDAHEFDVNDNPGKKVVKIYSEGNLIAKKIANKKSNRFFGVANYKTYLTTN